MSKTPLQNVLVLAALACLTGCATGTSLHQPPGGVNLEGARQPFVCESVARRENFVDAALGMGVSRENAQTLYDISGAESTDVVTGFAPAPDRIPTVERAIERVATNANDSAFYVEVDIQNLGGLNQELGHSKADAVYGEMAGITEQHIRALNTDACSFRHGGDEFSFVVVAQGATQEQVETALDVADQKIRQYIAQQGLADIEHPKHPGDPAKSGAGILFGVSRISEGDKAEDVFSAADTVVERKKQE